MIKKVKKDGNPKESKIISTQDIVLGTDATTTLDEVILEQRKDIENLKKWTKWSIKYGGMGTGSGGGSGPVTSFGYKLYIFSSDYQRSTEVAEGSTTKLDGPGNYILSVNLSKTQGHAFRFTYQVGINGNKQSVTIPEGETTREVNLRNLTERFVLFFEITDLSTEDSTGTRNSTIIPETYTVQSCSLTRSDGIPLNNKASGLISFVTDESLGEGLIASMSYVINEKDLSLYFKIRYKFSEEGENEWTYIEEEISSGDSESLSGTISKQIKLDRDLSEYYGQNFVVQISIGLENNFNPQDNRTYEPELLPIGYYISLYDKGVGSLYLDLQKLINAGEDANKVNRGYLPFTINLRSTTTGDSRPVTLTLYLGGKSTVTEEWIWSLKAESTSNLSTNKQYEVPDMFKITVSDAGYYKIVCSTGASSTTTVKYFEVSETDESWSYTKFQDDYGYSGNTTYINYDSDGPKTTNNPFLSNTITIYNNSYRSASLGTMGPDVIYSANLVLGFQYDASNEDGSPFMKVNLTGGESIFITQNKMYDSKEDVLLNYYLPKTDIPNETDKTKWHLFHLNINHLYVDQNIYYHEFCLYIDGQLEGISKTSSSDTEKGITTALGRDLSINSVEINYDSKRRYNLKLNLLELSRIPGNKSEKDRLSYEFIYDNYAVTYYNKYLSDLGRSTEDSKIDIDNTMSFKFDNLSLPYLEAATLGNLLFSEDKKLDIPVLVLVPDRKRGDLPKIQTWFYTTWPQINDDNQIINSSAVYYIPPSHTDKGLENYIIKTSSGDIAGFSFEIQGSSTKSYGVKNLELKLTVNEEGKTTLFTPNFDKDSNDNENNFLPEESFTLKADLVDSSLCNNNSIGSFVNKNVSNLGETDEKDLIGENIRKYIKKCLVGFPVLVFIGDVNISEDYGGGEDVTRYYYTGIYNFNLGRKSYFNLGYYSENTYNEVLTKLNEAETNSSGWKIISIENRKIEYNKDLTVVEISENNDYWDFSQYDDTVLFEIPEDPDTHNKDNGLHMFRSDILEGTTNIAKANVKTTINLISKAGGYIFGKLKKNFYEPEEGPYSKAVEDNNNNLISLNGVTNYRQQYYRLRQAENKKQFFPFSPPLQPEGQVEDFRNCVDVTKSEDSIEKPRVPWVNLPSLVEYYVICMCFGMVDSVMKNLQLKSWGSGTTDPSDGKNFYAAFYDMDTALGVNNVGEEVGYFAFSDFWRVKNNPIAGTSNEYLADTAEIYPDYWEKNRFDGFDRPSTYLFALAKYSTMSLIDSAAGSWLPSTVDSAGEKVSCSPINIYSRFRSILGDLRSADYFMDNFFIKRLINVPTPLVNLNIRAKYAKITYWGRDPLEINNNTNGSQIVQLSTIDDIGKFTGSGKFKKRQWLNSRLHLLDAYLCVLDNISFPVRYARLDENSGELIGWEELKSGNESYFYPKKESSRDTYEDVEILNTIFGKNFIKSTLGEQNIKVKAPNLTPIFFYNESVKSLSAFLVGDDNLTNDYVINLRADTNVNWALYGSRLLKYIDNLGKFNLSSATIDTNNLKYINFISENGVSGTSMNDITLKTPNIESLIITGNKFTGSLKFNDNTSFNKLTKIDLSGSTVSINNERLDCQISELNLSSINTNRSDGSIVNVGISIPNIRFTEDVKVSLNNSTIETLNIPVWQENIEITSDEQEIPGTYTGVKITNLNLSENKDFLNTGADITLRNISNLETVVIGTYIKSLTIDGCSNLRDVQIISSNKINVLESIRILNCSNDLTDNRYLTLNSEVAGEINLEMELLEGISVNFKETSRIKAVKIGNNVVNLEAEAFRNTDLVSLDNSNEGVYYINGTHTFYLCPDFTLKQSDGISYPTLLVSKNLSNLTRTFSPFVDGSSSLTTSITLDAINNFLENNKDTKRDERGDEAYITNIDRLCTNQIGIGGNNGSNWFWNSELKLSGYKYITTCTHAFSRCGINKWTKKLFNFGNSSGNSLALTSPFFSGGDDGALVATNYLSNVKNNVTSIQDSGPVSSNVQYYTFFKEISQNEYQRLEEVKLSDIFSGCTKLKTLMGPNLNNSSSQWVNLEGGFSTTTNITDISRFLYQGNWKNATWNYEDGGITNTTSFLQILTQLNSFTLSFGNSENSRETLDLFNLFTAEQWYKVRLVSASNISTSVTRVTNFDTFSAMFSARKTISEENFNTLISYLVTGYLGTRGNLIEPIFWNCSVTNCGGENLSLRKFSSELNKVLYTYGTFRNLKAYNTTGIEIPIRISDDFFDSLKKVKTCEYLFSGTWLEKVPPFNFFRKRKQTEIKTGFARKKILNENLSPEQEEINYVYSTNITTPTNPSAPDLTNLELWSNITPEEDWEKNKHYWRAIKTGTTISNPELIFHFESKAVNVRYTPYDNGTIVNISYMFYNSKYKEPRFNKSSLGDLDSYKSYIRDNDNNEYDKYYTDEDCTTIDSSFRKSLEIDDLSDDIELDEGSGVFTVQNQSTQFKNHQLAIYDEGNKNYPIISPDFFLGTTNSCISNYVFGIQSTQDTVEEVPGGEDKKYLLQGYLPKNLLVNKNPTLFKNFLLNQNVLPTKETDRIYVFVPSKFITYNSTSFDGLLNFHIRVPTEHSTENYHSYYIFHKDSLALSSGTKSFASGLPQRASTSNSKDNPALYYTGNGTNALLDVVGNNYNFRYYLVYDGYFDSVFGAVNYSSMFSPHFIYLLSDSNAWSNNFNMTKLVSYLSTTNRAIISGTMGSVNNVQYGVNKNFKFPTAIKNVVRQDIYGGNTVRLARTTVGDSENYYTTAAGFILV